MEEMKLDPNINTNITQKEPPIRCTKDDEFLTSPCTCPECAKEQNQRYESGDFGKNTIVVTDEYLTPEIQAMWSGFIFVCPVCQKPAIMVNKHLGKFCSFCGQPVVVKSYVLTDYVKKLQQNKRI